MHANVIMVLGRGVWIRGASGWYQQLPREPGETLTGLFQDAVESMDSGRVTLVYEPAGMAHQEVECPKASRKVFASISKVRSEFPVVVSEDLGWGMEPPVPVVGGSYSTMVHYEPKAGLSQICAERSATSASVVAAWSSFTVAESCAPKGSPRTADQATLILLPGFVAYCGCTRGRRHFRTWQQPLAERDWRALVFMASGSSEQPGIEERRRTGITVVSEGEPTSLCPFWDEIRNSGNLESFVSLDEFAGCAAQMPRNHPANLVLGFPSRLDLDPYFSCLATAGLLAAAYMAVTARMGLHERVRLGAESEVRVAAAEERVEELERNRSEAQQLQKDIPDAPDLEPASKSNALREFAAAIPDELTLTRLSLAADNRFEMDAVLVGKEFDRESFLRSLAQHGLSAALPGSCVFDPASRQLAVSGKILAAR